MQAMVFDGAGSGGKPLTLRDVKNPTPEQGQALLKVLACGICRTDLHIIDGELTDPALPLIPGHQIVGQVMELGSDCNQISKGQIVGVPWLGSTCGQCHYCDHHQENLCDDARFTGYHLNGGFAEYCTVDERFCFPIPDGFSPEHAAPLLCAGLIGYRCLRICEDAKRIGLYGFGAAAHILCQVAVWQGREVFAFTRPGDTQSKAFAKQLGAAWVGDSDQTPKQPLDAAIIFAPDGTLVPRALKAVRKGGIVVCGGIHMSDIPGFPYEDLWGERRICSVANLTRQDGVEFLQLAPQIPIETQVSLYPLVQANEALDDLRHGRFDGAAVVVPA